MKFESEIRNLLIENTIRAVAEGGFEKATVKELAHTGDPIPGVKMNDVYVYRLFGSKDELYRAAFTRLDNELFDALRSTYSAIGGIEGSRREKMYELFLGMWDFILKKPERLRSYVRYYYSIYFPGQSSLEHNKRFRSLLGGIASMFKAEADVNAIMHSVFIMLLDFSIRVLNGELENSEVNVPHIFNVLYCMMLTYFDESVTV